MPAGVHRGIAVADAYGSYTAGVVEVAVDSKNRIALKRVVIGIDPGYVVDVDAAKAQIEGGIIFALSAIVYGEITLADGRVTQRNFNDYRMLFLRDAPVIEAVPAPTGGFGCGLVQPPRASVPPPCTCGAQYGSSDPFAVPKPSVYTRTPRSKACCAAPDGGGPALLTHTVRSPSVSGG